jgi:receptor protein-tyrosine kinase
MSIIEQAAKRLEELSRAGVAVPWAAAGLAGSDLQQRLEGADAPQDQRPAQRAAKSESPALRRPDRGAGEPSLAHVPTHAPAHEPEMVTLDLERLQREGHIVSADTRSGPAQEFRHIKRPLLRNAREASPDQRMSLIRVTSALPGEGKTFCAVNLAMSLAIEVDRSVLLVDADVVHPDVLKRLGLPPRKGLMDVLTDSTLHYSDMLLKTNVPKLSILPAGTSNTRSTEILASDAMDRLLAELAGSLPDHIVVFDAPPLLVTTEAKVLASHVGQVVMVVESMRTPRSAVETAFAALDQCPCVMSILNKGDEPAVGYGYGDYYG